MNQRLFATCIILLNLTATSQANLSTFFNPSGANLSNVSTNHDILFLGEAAGNIAGLAVASAGDVDADGLSDILIGAPKNDEADISAGKSYLFKGSTLSRTNGYVDLSSADVSFLGEIFGDTSGSDVNSAGDIDGDGLDDIIITAPGADIATETTRYDQIGKTYIFLGSSLASLSGTISLSDADIIIQGGQEDEISGSFATGCGDVDADGYADVLIAAINHTGVGTYSGQVYLFMGSTLTDFIGDELSVDSADIMFRGESGGDRCGYGIAGAGDIDGDGYADILMGAPYHTDVYSNEGKAYLFYGSSLRGMSGTYAVNEADLQFTGESSDNFLGWSCASAGDIDGDALDDILLGAYGYNSSAGKTYLLYGSTLSGLSGTNDISAIADVQIAGDDADDRSGSPAVGLGDIDGDGADDILISSYLEDDSGPYAGNVYLFTTPSLLELDSTEISVTNADFKFVGEAAADFCGYDISPAGDINGDGASDLLIGAMRNDDGGLSAGKIYLIHGLPGCRPTDTIHVNGAVGNNTGFGGPDCPNRTIASGLDHAEELALTQVVVHAVAIYTNDIALKPGIALKGDALTFDFLPISLPTILNLTNDILGASDASLQYFAIFKAGIDLQHTTNMLVRENSVYREDTEPCLILSSTTSNTIQNNLFIQNGPGEEVIYMGPNSQYNQFINNTLHNLSDLSLVSYITGLFIEDTPDHTIHNNTLLNAIIWCTDETGSTPSHSYYGIYATETNDIAIQYTKTPPYNTNVTTTGGGNIVGRSTPRFIDPMPTGSNYRLQNTFRLKSPCINTASPDPTYNDPDGTRGDMGAFGGPYSLDFEE